jgi:hypothetical protein
MEGGCRYAMAPNGVGYRKSNSLRKVPKDEDSPITIRRVLSGREEGMKESGFWMSFMVGASSARQRLWGEGWQFSLVFWQIGCVAPRGTNRSSAS